MRRGRRLLGWLAGGLIITVLLGTATSGADAQDIRITVNMTEEQAGSQICASDMLTSEGFAAADRPVARMHESMRPGRLGFPVIGGQAATKENSSPCSVEMSDMGGFCIDKQPSPGQANWYDAADSCQARGKRLCANEEWLQACDASPINAVAAMPGLEWLANWVFETSEKVFDSMDHGYFRCRTSSQPRPASRPFEVRKFRCCR